jgi:hypothetical protein
MGLMQIYDSVDELSLNAGVVVLDKFDVLGGSH